jgi:hypothetical protein
MRPALVRLIPLVALVLAGACSHHPTFGRPMPQDTIPTTKERPEPKEKAKDPRRPPDGYQGLERGRRVQAPTRTAGPPVRVPPTAAGAGAVHSGTGGMATGVGGHGYLLAGIEAGGRLTR